MLNCRMSANGTFWNSRDVGLKSVVGPKAEVLR